MENDNRMEKVVDLCRRRGFVFPGSEIYGGLSNSWDYGPLGVELKNNIKKAWWKKFVQECEFNVGLDAAILMNPSVWKASGHLDGFSDPLTDCKSCKARYRADKLVDEDTRVEGKSSEEILEIFKEKGVCCPKCGSKDFTEIRNFNLMFKTYQGVVEGKKNEIFLRPETAQGIFVNFKNVEKTMRKKLPFGIAQIGKSFRNEITPGNFIFRTREFEQMELEFFCKPGEDMKWFEFWVEKCKNFLVSLGIKNESIRIRAHEKEELSHYSLATSDIEFLFPFGWGELWGVADRTDYDLTSHENHSKKSLKYFDPVTEEKYTPFCIEPSLGVDRAFLAFVSDAYYEEKLEDGETRVVLKLSPVLAPFKAAVLPLTKKLSDEAKELFKKLSFEFVVDYDDAGSIGKRYRRQDEIGTPYCITFDYESVENNTVTIRERDSMEQKRVEISSLNSFLREKVLF